MKITEAQKRAQANYFKRLKEAGYKRISFIMRPEWKPKVKQLLAEEERNNNLKKD